MDRFARIVVGYHGCRAEFAARLLLNQTPIADRKKSQNTYDWLGHGVYFWEHAPERAWRWARERYGEEADVVGAIVQLGECFDLLDEKCTAMLGATFDQIRSSFEQTGRRLPSNRGRENKLRELDCTAINECLAIMSGRGLKFDGSRSLS